MFPASLRRLAFSSTLCALGCAGGAVGHRSSSPLPALSRVVADVPLERARGGGDGLGPVVGLRVGERTLRLVVAVGAGTYLTEEGAERSGLPIEGTALFAEGELGSAHTRGGHLEVRADAVLGHAGVDGQLDPADLEPAGFTLLDFAHGRFVRLVGDGDAARDFLQKACGDCSIEEAAAATPPSLPLSLDGRPGVPARIDTRGARTALPVGSFRSRPRGEAPPPPEGPERLVEVSGVTVELGGRRRGPYTIFAFEGAPPGGMPQATARVGLDVLGDTVLALPPSAGSAAPLRVAVPR